MSHSLYKQYLLQILQLSGGADGQNPVVRVSVLSFAANAEATKDIGTVAELAIKYQTVLTWNVTRNLGSIAIGGSEES